MEKTALAQFIEWYSDLHKGAAALRPSPLRVKKKATELLETEKQQIVNAKNDKLYQIETGGEKYYTETFKP